MLVGFLLRLHFLSWIGLRDLRVFNWPFLRRDYYWFMTSVSVYHYHITLKIHRLTVAIPTVLTKILSISRIPFPTLSNMYEVYWLCVIILLSIAHGLPTLTAPVVGVKLLAIFAFIPRSRRSRRKNRQIHVSFFLNLLHQTFILAIYFWKCFWGCITVSLFLAASHSTQRIPCYGEKISRIQNRRLPIFLCLSSIRVKAIF